MDVDATLDALRHLSEHERGCLLRYLERLNSSLGTNLKEIRLFGSAVRGDMWPDWMPIHSDIDLLVLTDEAVPKDEQQRLVDSTYEYFLECGRQLSPTFWTVARFASPDSTQASEFAERVRAEGRVILSLAH